MSMLRPRRWILGAFLPWALCALQVQAQDTYNLFFASTSIEAEPGEAVSVSIALENTPEAVTGFSFGVRHNADLMTLSLDGVAIGADLQAAIDASCGASGVDTNFFAVRLTEGGFTAAAILRTNECESGQLAPGQTHSLLEVTYQTDPDATGVGEVSITSDLGEPPVAVLLDLGGTAQVATSPGENTTARVRLGGGVPFLRGDVNQNGTIDLSDPILILNFLFSGGLPPGRATAENCLVAYNFDGSTETPGLETEQDIELNDGIAALNLLFRSGAPPPAPYPRCGLAPNTTSARLACNDFRCN